MIEIVIDLAHGLLFNQEGELDERNQFAKFKALMNHPYWHYGMAAIINTRRYSEGLDFVYTLITLNEHYHNCGELPDGEYAKFDQRLILFRLQLLDKLDWWHGYIELFERMRVERSYTMKYVLGRKKNPDFMKYFLWEDKRYQYVHFLYQQDHRYELIKRKIEKVTNGKRVKNLKHHPLSELSDEEIQRRFDQIIHCAEHGIPVFINM